MINIDDEPAAFLAPYAKVGDDLEIEFLSSGYHLPASMYGGADRMGWAEEGDDERIVVAAYVNGIQLPPEVAERLGEEYYTQIEKTELEGDYR